MDSLKPLTKASLPQIDSQILLSLINNMSDGVLVVNHSFNIDLYNSSILNLTDRNNIKTKASLSDVLVMSDSKGNKLDLVAYLEGIETTKRRDDLIIRYSDNSFIYISLTVSKIKNAYGKKGLNGYILTIRDISREKSLDKERDEFISVVSHELRTPITIIEGNLSNIDFLIEKGAHKSEIAKAAKSSHDQAIVLSNLINDLTSLSRAEHAINIDKVENINVVILIKNIYQSYLPKTIEKSIKLDLKIDPELTIIKSSKLYINEILENFLNNAIKYTAAGYIHIGVRKINDAVEFVISDTGIGISKSDQEKIFNKFYRSGNYATAQASGTGLGLYISRKIANLIGADIQVKSDLGKGSTFTLIVPNLEKYH